MLRVLICDDDETIVNKVDKYINEIMKTNNLELIIDCKNSGDFMLIENTAYDIAVIDIEMHGINGLRLAELLKKANHDIQIIVLTSFNQYLDDAMQVHVFRYMSKPIEKNRFVNNFIAAIKEYKLTSKIVLVEVDDRIIPIKTNNILYIENLKYGSIVYTKHGEYKTNKKPKVWYDEINQPSYFVYSHNSILINLQNVIDFNKNTITLRKNDDETVNTYMSQRKYSSFKKSFFEFAGGLK